MIRTPGLTLTQLKEDIRTFLDSPNPSIARIRDEVLDPLAKFGRAYVIGGLIRDIAMHGLEERPESDLDLVVRCSPRRLEEFAERRNGVKNRFGGFAIRTEAYRVDFWSFSKTWAKTAGHVNLKTPADLTKTTFFDWDAVVYSIMDHKLWAIDRYLYRLHSGVVDINLEENPSELGTLVRALRRLMMWDARPSGRLSAYIHRQLKCFAWGELLRAEQGAFATQYLTEFDSNESYKSAVLQRASFYNRNVDRLRDVKFVEIERAPRVYAVRTHDQFKISRATKKRKAKRAKAEHFTDLFAK